MGIESSISCDYRGCGAQRREVNNWYVVSQDTSGVHIFHWDECPQKAMKDGKHFCGISHTMQSVSNFLTPNNTKSNRESTLELKPPLARDGTAPEPKEVLDTPKETEL